MPQKPTDPITKAAYALLIIAALTLTGFLIYDHRYQTGVFGNVPSGGVELKK